MTEPPVTITLEPEPADLVRAAVLDGLRAFNRRHAEAPDFQPLTLAARDPGGALLGGLVGETGWRWLHVDLLWVAEPHRGRGLGRRLLHAGEREALARGCRHVFLDTFDYQARPFYEREGYEQFGVQEDYPPGHRRFFLRKTLGVALALLAVFTGPAHAQAVAEPRGVVPSLAVTHVRFSEQVGQGASRAITGPTLGLTWLRPGGIGVDAALTYLPPTGFHDLTGAVADVGVAYAAGAGRAALLLRGGASGALAGDSDGGYLAGAGPYAGAGLLVRLAGRVALRADATARLYVGETPVVLGAGVGLALLPAPRPDASRRNPP